MKSVQICEGCGEEFIGLGLFCSTCGNVKVRTVHRIPKFGKDRYDPKRDKISKRKTQQENY